MEARKGAPARAVAEAPRAMQADVVICRGAKGAKRSGFARGRSSRRCPKQRTATLVWRATRANQKPARRVPAGAVRPIAFRQVGDFVIRVKLCCRPAVAAPAMGGATAIQRRRPDGEAAHRD